MCIRDRKNAIGAAVIPALMELVDSLREVVTANFDIIRSGISKFMNGFITVVRNVTAFVGYLADGFSRFAGVLGGVVPLLKTFGMIILSFVAGKVVMGIFDIAKGFLAVTKAIKLVNIQALLIPALIGAAVLLVIAIVDDLFAFMEGRPSFLGYLIKNKDQILASISDAIDTALEWINNAFNTLFNWIQTGITEFFKFFGVPATEAEKAAATITNVFRGAFEFIKETLGGLADLFTSVFGEVVAGLKPIMGDIIAIINEPILFFERFPDIVSGIFTVIVGQLTRFATFAAETLLKIFGVPQEQIEVISSGVQRLFDGIVNAGAKAVNYLTSLFSNGVGLIKSILEESVGGIVGLVNFFGGDDKKETSTSPQTGAEIGQSIQNKVSNQQSSSNITVSPNITINQTGSTGSADDLAAKIRDELTTVAQSVGRANKPQFAN